MIGELESFKMLETENISKMFARFSKITNALKGLGKAISESEQVMKILRALPKSLTLKITAIEEAKDLNTLKLEDLISSLMSQELIKKRNEESHRGRRTLALKAQNSEESTSTSYEEEEEIALLTKKFRKFVRRERSSGNPKVFRDKGKKDKRKDITKCFRCGGAGHMQAQCRKLEEYKPKEILEKY